MLCPSAPGRRPLRGFRRLRVAGALRGRRACRRRVLRAAPKPFGRVEPRREWRRWWRVRDRPGGVAVRIVAEERLRASKR
eukprot:14454045-Alexandrium_andersonii.AAC.1